MHICYASSDEYAKYTGVALLSLLENNKTTKIDGVIILSYGIKNENKERINRIAEEYHKSIIFVDALGEVTSILGKTKLDSFHGSIATYSRAFIDLLVPDYVDRMLYVDSDTVTIGSVAELEELPMNEKVFGAVAESQRYDRIYRSPELLDKPEHFIYHGCGVVLYNLNLWRKRNCLNIVLDELKKNRKYRYYDQSLLNYCIPQEWIVTLPLKYNYWGHLYPPKRELYELCRGDIYTREQVMDSIENPVIIHYPGILGKAWYLESNSRRADLYKPYLLKTPWSSEEIDSIEPYLDTLFRQKGVKGRLKLYLLRIKVNAKTPTESRIIEYLEYILMKLRISL